MKISTQELKAFLKKTKPIWNNRQTLINQDWVLFDETNAYVFNGLLFYHEPFKFLLGAIPAQPVLVLLEKSKAEYCEFHTHDYASSEIRIDSTKAVFNYPFDLNKHVQSFFMETGTFSLIHSFNEKQEICAKHIHKESREYGNTYIIGSKMYATNGYRYITVPIEPIEATIPNTVNPILKAFKEPVRGIHMSPSVVSFKISNGILSALLPVAESDIAKYEPNFSVLSHEIEFANADEVVNILDTASKFDIEFKRKDLMVDVHIDKEQAVFLLKGVKMELNQQAVCKSDITFNFRARPSDLKDIFATSSVLYVAPESDFIATRGSNGETLYLWVELL
jgi:hypothetical protein